MGPRISGERGGGDVMATEARTRIRPIDALLAPLRLLERSRGWRRRLLIVVYAFLGLVAGVFIWWGTSLNELPDVGDPFDVQAFLDASRIPDSEDAFALYRKAAESYRDQGVAHNWNVTYAAMRSGWAKADPNVRAWVAANREALDLWRDATRRPRGIPEDLATARTFSDNLLSPLSVLAQAAILEGSRLEEEGDRAGALDWYVAAGRAGLHYSTRSRLEWRRQATMMEGLIHDRMIAWARDPRTDGPLLRRAITAVEDLDARAPPISDNLKAEYVATMRALDDPRRLARDLDRVGNSTYPYADTPRMHHVFWFLKREPDRSRRVARLFFANWLSQCDKPTSARPKATGNHESHPIWAYFNVTPDGPPEAHAIEPVKLFAGLQSTAMLWRFLPMYPAYAPDAHADRQSRGTLLVHLAEQLYLRETGNELPSIEALVPKYLKRIPPDYVEINQKP